MAALLEAYHHLRDGVPPEGADQLQSAAKKSLDGLFELRSELGVARSSSTGECRQFADISERLAGDIQSGVARFSMRPLVQPIADDREFESANRLQIDIAAFSQLDFLMRTGGEGGYSVVDASSRSACPFSQREKIAHLFGSNLISLTDFFRAAFGSPGLAQMTADQNRLIRLIQADDKAENRRFWTIMAVGTAASAVLWEFGPPITAFGVRLIWGYTPRLLAVPAVLYGMKFSALVTEGVAFSYADQATAIEIEPSKSIAASWDEHMNSIAQLLDSPTHAPEIQLLFLSRVQALIFSDTIPWLNALSGQLAAEESKWGSLENAIEHYKGGASVDQR